ncbi:helix-turn-helix domain-containing protein [Sulfobacillus harzensis]|uniref:Helix-turn-helix transcriptional regulator n=1 Tax=Sulfobacillus harzensis TaxID=2729629 RepID=A0A7Y0Q334_9FIRM|nr:helix-turn-helix transcriptional regulator [Sulfobacillus harzensis]NMP23793.1 helix-turn-helix transcriptional regulator [Sulfobacillus harzensis]
MNPKIIFGDRLAQARQAKGWTKQALADQIGVSDVMVGYWEHGHRWPSIDTLVALAEALDVSTDWLLGLSPHVDPSWNGGADAPHT